MHRVRRVTMAVDIPVVLDTDTGFGNVTNVFRCVREAEANGVAAIKIEDQMFPKKCGHFEGTQVVPVGEMVGKIKAAIEARQENLVIVARTDARAVISLEEALSRANAYVESGAHVIFLEAPRSKEEMEKIAQTIKVPLIVNIVEGGKTPQMSFAELEALGFKFILYPTASIRATSKALMILYNNLRVTESTANMLDKVSTFDERNQINGLAWYTEWERRFGSKDAN